MKKNTVNSTIAAISTPFGRGGIAVIRISGADAVETADKMFVRKNKCPLGQTEPGRFVCGDILHEKDIIDSGMAVVFRAPHSYTGEDIVELHCHGGIALAQTVLEAALLSGAVPAGAGEFTKRAFLNGKLGLSQAEAVIELIDAENKEKLKLSAAQSRGVLSEKINAFFNEIKALVSSIYVYIDFPDEDLTDISPDEMKSRLAAILDGMNRLISTYHTGRAVMNGIPTVIAGRPNTGKSSILNLLLGQKRALVSDIAGTTRDTIEETVVVGKVTLRLCDTAGIRNINAASDEKRAENADTNKNENEKAIVENSYIESLGIDRTFQKLSESELALAVFDSSAELNAEDEEVISYLKKNYNGAVIAVINKTDLENKLDTEKLRGLFDRVVEISAKTGKGTDKLTEEIEKMFFDGSIDYSNEAIITNARQYASLCSARDSVSDAITALNSDLTPDIAGLDLERALTSLSELDGRQVTEQIVNDIFHRFCVGK